MLLRYQSSALSARALRRCASPLSLRPGPVLGCPARVLSGRTSERAHEHKTRSFTQSAPVRQTVTASKPLSERLSLKGNVTVVTGGARGIGLSLAKGAAEAGSDVAILDTLPEPVEDLKTLEKELKVRMTYYRADVTNETVLRETFGRLVEDFRKIDGCITAAGVVADKPFHDHGWDEAKRILDVNVMGTFFAVQLATEQMARQATGGSVVMIASIVSHSTVPTQRISLYAASKGAVRILGRHLAVELASSRIRVNTISPGVIKTDMTDGLAKQYPHLLKMFETEPPLERPGEPKDLVPASTFLLSEASSYMTGNDLLITGGLHLPRIEKV